jgi:hypothetical protein
MIISKALQIMFLVGLFPVIYRKYRLLGICQMTFIQSVFECGPLLKSYPIIIIIIITTTTITIVSICK